MYLSVNECERIRLRQCYSLWLRTENSPRAHHELYAATQRSLTDVTAREEARHGSTRGMTSFLGGLE